VIVVFACAVITFVAAAWFFTQYLARLRPAAPLPNKKPPDKRRGLILLVSNEPTIRKAIEWHADTLEKCWLVCSTLSAQLAEIIKTDLERNGKQAETILVNDVLDVT
jgi:hypothetical protein